MTVAATSVVCAAGALVVGETVVIRGLAVAAAAATVVGSVLTRRWDRAAGKRVAQLTAARTREEWKTEERIAELETDLEETRLARTRLESKLRGKRAELARLRTEHADLLRRYAAAETGRASALEGRRLLAKGKAPGKALELEAAGAAGTRSEGTAPGAAAFRRAADALRDLERNAAAQRARAAAKPEPEAVEAKATESKPEPKSGLRPELKPASTSGPAPVPASLPAPKAVAPAKALAPAKAAAPAAGTGAALPAARRPASRAQGGFDFFGNKKASPAPKPVEEQDLADVVGEEALADAQAVRAVGSVEAVETDEVIDLTAHDETEQIDVAELRTAIS
ncbi:hypothetical protein [Streptomyces griseocarneus]|uniref:hypothetical protein n=1 Tax=Streptomyces griseocarneus TaxID=51201 RepID=UPI0019A502B8|nr:hypothetical protein [Streptomyces griseocarneus]GHG81872.1 hypothetical protein GCM10018779_64270 [Streptomyces griseocarneus]